MKVTKITSSCSLLCQQLTAVCLLTLLAFFSYETFDAKEAIGAEEVLSRVEVLGNERVESTTVLLQVKSKDGGPIDTAVIERDVKEIYRTGFFDQVVAKLRRAKDDFGREKVTLVFQVKEKPAIRQIKLVGNEEVSTEVLKEKLNIGARRFLDGRKILAGIEEAKAEYQNRGFYGTEIDYRISEVEDNQVDLAFSIVEGEEKVIREVVFEGNKLQDDDVLEDIVNTSRYKWWSSWLTGSGVVKKDVLGADIQELTRYYLRNGFVDVRIAEPSIEEIEDGIRVVFKITEGEQFSFGEIAAVGTLLEAGAAATLEGIASKSGETFNVEQLRQDAFLISEKFTDIGYAFANVEPESRVNRETRIVDVNFRIDQGELITINRINISGNKKTADNVVRRSLQIHEQELFSSSRIRRSRELLLRLGYFDEVTLTPERSGQKDNVDVNVAVREGNTGSFSVGAGVSSGDGFVVSSRVSETNLFGTGNAISFDVNTGSRRENYVVSFNNPRVNDSRLSFGADILSVEREFDDFDRDQVGGSISLGYPLWFLGAEYLDDVRFRLTYEYLKIDIREVSEDAPELIAREEGTSTSSSITPRLTRNTIDNPLDPSKGSRQSLSAQIAGIGGDEKFWLVQAANTFYYPLFKTSSGPFVFSNRVRFGYGETFNNEDFPLFRRFFPGGINSVRGFDSRELGPKDAQGNEFGGSKQLISNFEIIFPLFSSAGLKGVVFYDIGNAFDDNESIEFSKLRQAVGWGIRWRSPIAPIRVEIGYPLDREEGEKAVVTNFSFGSPL